VTYNILNLD